MTVAEAFRLLGLSDRAELPEINRAFRALVKTCHPDLNRDRVEWAHRTMSKLNIAYSTCRQHAAERLTEAKGETVKTHARAATADKTATAAADLRDELLDIVYLYYQYGLENIHLRREGTRRFRYRTVRRRLNGLRSQPARTDEPLTAAVQLFAAAFTQVLDLEQFGTPADPPGDRAAHRYLLEGTRALDNLIKRGFFAEFRADRSLPPIPKAAELASFGFLTVLTRYAASRWATDAAARLRLLEAAVNLLSLLEPA